MQWLAYVEQVNVEHCPKGIYFQLNITSLLRIGLQEYLYYLFLPDMLP